MMEPTGGPASPTRSPVPLHRAEKSVVDLADVTVRVGGRTILRDLTLSIERGEFVGLIGPNGAGKSTLLRVILGLQRVSRGSVCLFGEPARRGNPSIGYVPQHQSFHKEMPLRARDYVGLGVDGARFGIFRRAKDLESKVTTALEDVGAMGYAEAPAGLLSGGEQQRLMLAQALVAEPRLLLLDEPLANLDMRSRHDIVELVHEVSRQRRISVVFVAHDVNPLLPAMDRVLYLANGRGILGTPDEVIQGDVLTQLFGFPVAVVRVEGHVLVTAVGEGDDCHA